MGDVVVVPGAQEHGWGGSSPGHHETGKVGYFDLGLDVVEAGVDHEAGEGEEEAEDDEGGAQADGVGGEGEDEKHDCACAVGGDGVEVDLDGAFDDTADDLGHEEGDGLDGDTEADFNEEEAVRSGLFEDAEGFAEVELLVDDGGRVHLDSEEGEFLLLLVEEIGFCCGAREVPEGEYREEHGTGSLDQEEVSPAFELGVFDLENAKGEETGEGVGDVGGGVEDGETTGELTTTVEGG